MTRILNRPGRLLSLALVAFMFLLPLRIIVFADPLSPGEIQSMNEWPNWVADNCGGGTAADAASVTAGSGKPDGTTFPNLDPSAMAQAIDTYISKQSPGSPLKNLGATMVASGKNANVSPFLIVAIAQVETSLGTAHTRQVTEAHNIFDRAALSSQPHIYIPPVVSGQPSLWYKWSSVKASVDYTAPENQNASGGGDIFTYIHNQYGTAISSDDLVTFSGAYDTPSQASQYANSLKPAIEAMVNDVGSGGSAPAPQGGGAGGSTCACSTGSSDTTLVGNDNQQKIFNYFIGKGLSPAQSAGIDGNFGQESAWNPSSPGGYLAQWGGGRLTALQAFAQKQGKPVTDLGVQLDYVWLELTNGPGAGEDDSGVLRDLKNTKTAADAATVFSNEYERPGDPQLQNRIDYANQILSKYGSSAGGANAGSPCGGVVNCNGSVPGVTGLSDTRRNVVCIAEQELKAWDSGTMRPGFRPHSQDSFSKYTQNSDELWCADFASWVYDQAQYPLQQSSSWRVPAVQSIQAIGQQNNRFHWHPASSSYTPKPGDLALYGGSHVNIVTKISGNTLTVVGGDQQAGTAGYPDGSRVSEYTINGFYGGGISGYVAPD